MSKMTDEEIKKHILKRIDQDDLGHIEIGTLSKEFGKDKKEIKSYLRQLRQQGLIRYRTAGRWEHADNFDVTAKGKEYLKKDC